jgi:spore coat polysaccharide biosynthesis predicted glycosyltransferase SpsG
VAREFAADLVVLDILDTEKELVEAIKATGAKVVSFEDLGSGATVADLVVSDLYPNQSLGHNQLTSVENAVLAPSFESLSRTAAIGKDVNHVLVLFGGTDPSGLALSSLRALEEIGFTGKVSCVRGLGASEIEGDFKLDLEMLRDVKNMGALMASADLALSSAGRTITELMSIGVPTICLAQNQKELTHTHATKSNGVINLGLGSLISKADLAASIAALIKDSALRAELNAAALAATAKRSNAQIVKRIFDFLGF